MPRFMLETIHDPDPKACALSLDAAQKQGSHYLTNAYWGCEDDVHKAWVFVEAEDRADALRMVPVGSRHEATAINVRQYTPDEIRAMHPHLA